MATPTLTTCIDWYGNNPAVFTPAICTVRPLDDPALSLVRGRSGDYSTDSPGQATVTLDNSDHAYSYDRNWHDNPSFEVDSSGWGPATAPTSTAYGPAILATGGLVAYWRLGEAYGISAYDANGGANSGTYLNSPMLGQMGALYGDANTATLLNGTTQSVTVLDAASLHLGDVVSIEAWIFKSGSGYRGILSKGWSSYYLRLNADDTFSFLKSGVAVIVTSTVTVGTGWHHVVSTKNGATVKLYLDGTDVTGAVTNATLADGTLNLGIGCDMTGGAPGTPIEWFAGGLDEVALYGVALSAATVLAHYQLGATPAIAKVVDNAPGAGSAAGQGILPAIANAGVAYPIPYRFRAGQPYSLSIALKSVTGSTSIVAGIGSSTVASDVALTTGPITTSWATYTASWTPTADRTDAVVFVRVTAAATATVRLDAVQVNPGSAANAYIEAPTRGNLVPGRPVHIYATYSATPYPLFFGYIKRITPDPTGLTVTIVAYDPLDRMADIDAVVPSLGGVISYTPRDFRIGALGEYERGNRNLIDNPSFETATTNWYGEGSGGIFVTFARIVGDAAPGGGTACTEVSLRAIVGFPYRFYTDAIRLAPTFSGGQIYTVSAWLRLPGAVAGPLLMGVDVGTATYSQAVTPAGAWQRYSLSFRMPADTTASTTTGTKPPRFFLSTSTTNPTGVGVATVRIDNVMMTRGQALFAYDSTGGSGRWPNWCINGSFDSSWLNGWYNAWANVCTNGGFDVDLTGWSVTSGSILRDTTWSNSGPASLQASTTGIAGGTFFALTGTFLAGVMYYVGVWCKGGQGSVTIKSNGTPADTATAAAVAGHVVLNWTPTGTRTDAVVGLAWGASGPGLVNNIDDVVVCVVDSNWASTTAGPYYAANPNGGGVAPVSKGFSTLAAYGSQSQAIVTGATGAGRVFDFNLSGALCGLGVPYTLSMWLRSSDASCPVQISLGGMGAGVWDEATATATVNNTGWTQVTVTWTPSGWDKGSGGAWLLLACVKQTDSASRNLMIDGVRVTPGSSADSYELPQWSLDTGAETSDSWANSAAQAGTVASVLAYVNRAALTRHWIEPSMSSPWYVYKTQARSTTPALADTLTTPSGLTTLERDRSAVATVIPVVYGGGTYYASDQAAAAVYGTIVGSQLGDSIIISANAVDIGTIAIARYGKGVLRPTVTIQNDWPRQLARTLNDVIAVTVTGWLFRTFYGSIERITTTIGSGGGSWSTVYQLTEYPYPDSGTNPTDAAGDLARGLTS